LIELQSVLLPHGVTKEDPIFNMEMGCWKRRLETFKDWPYSITPEELVNVVLYWTKERDRCTCYFCGVCLGEWSKDDNPWLEHAIYSSDCPFIRLYKNKTETRFLKNPFPVTSDGKLNSEYVF